MFSPNSVRRFRPLFFAPAALCMAGIFWLSSRPAPAIAQEWPLLVGRFKMTHLVEYGVLAVLLIVGFRGGTRLGRFAAVSAAAGITVLWGITDEFHQYFVLTRTPAVGDVITDVVAAGVVCTAFLAACLVCDRPAKNLS